MTPPDPHCPPCESLDKLRQLLRTALNDYSATVDEDRYWQVPVPVAGTAAVQVAAHFDGRDPTPEEHALIKASIQSTHDDVMVERLLGCLKKKAAPFVLDLVRDDRELWRRAGVRLAIVSNVPDRNGIVVRALEDPSVHVRLAAAASSPWYADPERNARLANMISRTTDRGERNQLRVSLMQAAPGLTDPVVRAALLAGLDDDDDGHVRSTAIDEISRKLVGAADDEDVTDLLTAMFERLLVETDHRARQRLLDIKGYPRIGGYILERLTALLPDGLPPNAQGFGYFLRQFGPDALPLLEHLAVDAPPGTAPHLSIAAIRSGTVEMPFLTLRQQQRRRDPKA